MSWSPSFNSAGMENVGNMARASSADSWGAEELSPESHRFVDTLIRTYLLTSTADLNWHEFWSHIDAFQEPFYQNTIVALQMRSNNEEIRRVALDALREFRSTTVQNHVSTELWSQIRNDLQDRSGPTPPPAPSPIPFIPRRHSENGNR